MISVRPPDPDQVLELVGKVATSPFSYPHVGRTRGELPAGYNVDRYSIALGRGEAVFESAKAAERAFEEAAFEAPVWARVAATQESR